MSTQIQQKAIKKKKERAEGDGKVTTSKGRDRKRGAAEATDAGDDGATGMAKRFLPFLF